MKRQAFGFDFMVRRQEHHIWHIGLLHERLIDKLFLDSSCNFRSRLRQINVNSSSKIVYRDIFANYFALVFYGLIMRKKIIIVGIPSKLIWILIPIVMGFNRPTLFLQGQVAGVADPRKLIFWKVISKFIDLEVPNPIFRGPSFIKPFPHPLPIPVVRRRAVRPRNCLIYGVGANKSLASEDEILRRLRAAGFEYQKITSLNQHVNFDGIVEQALSAGFTFVSLDWDRYKLSPSGRVACDLATFDLIPLVLFEDDGTRKVLAEYQIEYQTI